MLNDTEITKYRDTFSLTDIAWEYIQHTRTSEPFRNVGALAVSNVCSAIYSNKMERTINTESRTAERKFFLLCEYDDSILEIWEQPQPVKLVITNKKGRKQKITYTPDFLVLTTSGPQVIEVKTQSKLQELVNIQPKNWGYSDSEGYSYRCAEEVFEGMGLVHLVFAGSPEKENRVANIELLLLSRERAPIDEKYIKKLKKQLRQSSFISLYDCKNYLSLDSFTPIIQWIDSGELFFDIDNSLLSEPHSCFVTIERSCIPFMRELLTKKQVCSSETYTNNSLGFLPSAKALTLAISRLKRIESGEKSRSVRRWKKLITEQEGQGLSKLQILCMKDRNKGNSQSKIPIVVEKCLLSFITETFSKNQGQLKHSAYWQYCSIAADEHPIFEPVSFSTFLKRCEQLSNDEFHLKRGGKRAANAASAPTEPSTRSIKRTIPWQCASIDHYLTDIYLVVNENNNEVYVARPWLTAIVDNATGEVLATSISFKSPSRVSCAKVIRSCVRKHGLLPREVIVDRGSDFRSNYFQALMAHYGITYTQRPSSHSRYGAEVERFFGQFKQEWLCNRPGNLADYKEARSVDGSKVPKNSATLIVAQFIDELELYLNWRSNKSIIGSYESKELIFKSKSAEYDLVPIPVKYNDEFLIVTAVETHRYKIDFQRGIHIGELHYYTPKFLLYKGRKKDVQVRIDPENPFIVYVFIDGSWELCFHEQFRRYKLLTPSEQIEIGLIHKECMRFKRKIAHCEGVELAKIVEKRNVLAETLKTGKIPNLATERYEAPASVDYSSLPDLDVEEW